MGHLHRFRKMCAIVVLASACKNKQDSLATELRTELGLPEKTDLRPLVSRYVSGDVVNSGFFEAIHLVFWRTIVRGDYPLHFLIWLERAYASYDLADPDDDPLRKRENLMVRALLAEARLLFSKSDPHGETAYPRYEATRRLMLGIAAGVEQRTLKTGRACVENGLKHLEKAIGLFAAESTERTRSDSDEFHMACALHMVDWLLSELPESENLRKETLECMERLGAVRAYDWLAGKINDWQHQYNLTEIRGELTARAASGPASPAMPLRAAIDCLIRAIELNPRLADFNLVTEFDGLDEPLSKAPALQHILPALKHERKEWLAERVRVYRRHTKLYEQDVTKGIKAMLMDLKSTEKTRNTVQRVLAAITGAAFALATSGFLQACLAKPIF